MSSTRSDDRYSSSPLLTQLRELLDEDVDDDLLLSDNFATRSTRNASDATKANSVEGHFLHSDQVTGKGTPLDRPNRFFGHPSVWKEWTAAERSISASIDQVRARDLSLHIYNARALEKRARESGQDVWKPPRLWTAWPMTMRDVPKIDREDWNLQNDGDDDEDEDEDEEEKGWRIRRKPESSRAILEALIVATVSKESRRKFSMRMDEEEFSSTDDARPGQQSSMAGKAVHANTPITQGYGTPHDEYSSSLTSDDGDATSSSSEPSHRRLRSSHTPPKRETGDDPASKARESHGPVAHGRPGHGIRLLKPVISADDEYISSIVQPSARHILSSLDRLLMALHDARKSFLQKHEDAQTDGPADEGARSRTTSAHPKSRSGQRSKSVQGSKPLHKARRSSSSDSNSNFSDAVNQPESYPARPRRQSSSGRIKSAKSRARNQARLGLRDWSDVLGVAAMIGWNPRVLDATRKRCGALFDESMDFAIIDHARGDGHSPGQQVKSEDEMFGGVHVDGFLKPITIGPGRRGKDKKVRKNRYKPEAGERSNARIEEDHAGQDKEPEIDVSM